MLPEAEENGAHAQEANCSLQRKIRKSANVDCCRWTYCTVYGTSGKKKRKKSWIFIIRKKMNHSEIRILILIS